MAYFGPVSRDKDLPSFSKYIIEINRKLSSDSKHLSASELSNIILKDYAFATKLLKLVNSAYYTLFRGKITTITRAVVLLGFEKVSMAAASLLLFEHLKSKSSVPELCYIYNDTEETKREASLSALLKNYQKHISLSKKQLSGVIEASMEKVKKHFGFNRAVFFLMNENKKKLEARFGYGRNIEHIAKRFSFEIAGTQSIFSIALAKQKDIIIPDTREGHIHQLIPQWFRHRFNTPSFVFLPITYEKTCIGAFYADRENPVPSVTRSAFPGRTYRLYPVCPRNSRPHNLNLLNLPHACKKNPIYGIGEEKKEAKWITQFDSMI